MIDVKEKDICGRLDRYKYYLGYICRIICEIFKEGYYYI